MFYPAASRYIEWELQTLHMTYCFSSFNTAIASEYIWGKMGMLHRQNFIEINLYSGKGMRTGRRIKRNQDLLLDSFLLVTLVEVSPLFLYLKTKGDCERKL